MERKQTNPKDALGIKKAPLHCVPCGPLYELGLAMMEGGRKYGAHNYRAVGTRASVYYDAAMRHLTQWWEGGDIDSDSGLHHLIKVAACCVVMRDSMLMGNDVDDRPIKYPSGLDMGKLNEQAAKLIDKITKCVTPFTEKQHGGAESSEKVDESEFIIAKLESRRHNRKGDWWVGIRINGCVKYLYPDLKLRASMVVSGGYYCTEKIARAYLAAYEEASKPFVCPVGWKVAHNCTHGWWVCSGDEYLRKNGQLYRSGTGYNGESYGKAPGYWPTKEAAETALVAYLEKTK